MSVAHVGSTRRTDAPRILAVLSVVAILVALPFGPAAMLPAAGFAIVAMAVALRDTVVPVFTWASGVALFVYVVWLIPIKGYTLPVTLPFNLEYYRLLLLVLVLLLACAVAMRRGAVRAAGAAPALLVLAGAAGLSAILNVHQITEASGPGVAVKQLSYFLSFLMVFVLVASVIRTREQVDAVVRALVLGGVVVAIAALYEARSGYNVFDHLNQWFPALKRLPREVLELRAGQTRVYASAQHPIALGTVLLLVAPLAVYLSVQARTAVKRWFWLAGAVTVLIAATATVSRTIVVMGIAMLIVVVKLRGPQVKRFWPVLLVLPFVIHVAAPGTMGGIYKAFSGTTLTANDPRAGLGGSGRLSDLGPGLRMWGEKPLVGQGLGMTRPTFTDIERTPGRAQVALVFDNQYLGTLVDIGFIGLCGTLLFIWGGVIRLYRTARQTTGAPSDLLVACAASMAGYGTAMLLFDAFSFVQGALVFFVIAAIGLSMVSLAPRVQSAEPGRAAA